MGRLFRARHAIEPFLFCWKAALRDSDSVSVAFHPSKEEENSSGDDLRRLLIEILSMVERPRAAIEWIFTSFIQRRAMSRRACY
ncbi:hypothetical protein AWV80_23785 [Cupriavidus sp. UYMU48A]|nr:hypothetical protein AWV80_23785 [Cupriavidus sp. UYMU48A]